MARPFGSVNSRPRTLHLGGWTRAPSSQAAPHEVVSSLAMKRPVAAPAQCVLAALGIVLASAASCGGDDASGDSASSRGGTNAEAGENGAGGTTGRGGAGDGGAAPGGEGGSAGGSAGSGAICAENDDCVPLGVCYSAFCDDGVCRGSPLARGSACGDGLCNGF